MFEKKIYSSFIRLLEHNF